MIESLRRLMPYIRPLKNQIILMFLLGFGVTLLSGLLPIVIQLLVAIYERNELTILQKLIPDSVAEYLPFGRPTDEQVARYLPFFFPILFLFLGIFRFAHYTLLSYTAERIIAAIRMDLVRKIMRLNLSFHGSVERGSGALISRVFNDPVVLQYGLTFYVDLIREPIQAAIYLTYMIWLDWQLTLFALIFLPLFLFFTKKIAKSLRKYGTYGREAMEDLTATLKEVVDGIRVVQSFNLEKELESRFQQNLNHYLNTAKKIIMREQAWSPISEFLISFLVMAFAIYSIKKVLGGEADTSTFIGFIAAAGFLQAPIKKLQDAGVKIQQAIVVTERIFELLESKEEVPEAKNPKTFPKDWKTITFRNVTFTYGRETVLKGINLTVNRGEVVAIVGESGSGKSTLVNLLERFYDPTSGEILIDDIPISEIALDDLRKNIALVTQDVFLFRDSVRRNIHAGDFTKPVDGVESAAKLANAHNFISAIPQGYETPVGERGAFLSGGEKQRVSIARAIFKDAPILILDEATSALDSVSEMEVQKGLNHLLENRTAFVIAHRLSTIFNADRIIVMKKGRIVEEGNHETLLKKGGEYYNFFQLQMNHDERARRALT